MMTPKTYGRTPRASAASSASAEASFVQRRSEKGGPRGFAVSVFAREAMTSPFGSANRYACNATGASSAQHGASAKWPSWTQ